MSDTGMYEGREGERPCGGGLASFVSILGLFFLTNSVVHSFIGRKPMSEQVGDKMKPDTEKSTTEHMRDKASGMYDRAAGAAQPESQKSTSQKMGDSMRGSESKGTMESIKETMKGATGMGGDKK